MSFTALSGSSRGAAIAALLLCRVAGAGDIPQTWAGHFGDHQACALVLETNRHTQRLIEFGADQCALPQSPCSTFKIPNALIGLQTGVVSGPQHAKAWDGTEHSRSILNQDHTLDSAIEHSVVWYFQSLARDIGAERMAFWLAQLGYGNQDISAGIDRFWLGASLRISPREQLDLLKRLRHQTLPIRPAYQQQVTDMLARTSDLPGTLFAKTGSCRADATTGEPDLGWFVGWINWHGAPAGNPATTYFVFNTRGNEAWGWEARKAALQVLAELQP